MFVITPEIINVFLFSFITTSCNQIKKYVFFERNLY